uniref:SERTA domain-containing protein n=1 Tax=Steinernema glaseri TaxID=37863 RepID=A0A1I7Y404_9BILA
MFDFLLAPSTTNGSSSPSTTATLSSSTSPHYSRFSTLAAEMEADHRVGSAGILSSSPNLLSSSARNATFGSSSAPAEVERKRAMLNLSISKIQTINTSHAPISLRKSVLIYNTLKCLQVGAWTRLGRLKLGRWGRWKERRVFMCSEEKRVGSNVERFRERYLKCQRP